MTFQHRFVASLVVMSFVVFILSLATRNLGQSIREASGPELTEFRLMVPEDEVVSSVELPNPADMVPLDDPMNLAVVVAVGLTRDCMVGVDTDYFLPVEVRLSTHGVEEARLHALGEDVGDRLDCIAAAIWATRWPMVHGTPPWIHFSIPPMDSTIPG